MTITILTFNNYQAQMYQTGLPELVGHHTKCAKAIWKASKGVVIHRDIKQIFGQDDIDFVDADGGWSDLLDQYSDALVDVWDFATEFNHQKLLKVFKNHKVTAEQWDQEKHARGEAQ